MKTFSVDLYEYFGVTAYKKGCNGRLDCYMGEEYVREDTVRPRPAVLIMPGGGYTHLSSREAEPVALKFLSEGFNAFVLYYTVNMPFPTQIIEADMAMAYIRMNSIALGVKSDKIACLGFSAGGHLAATLSTMPCGAGKTPILEKFSAYTESGDLDKLFRPDASVLCYPVILTDERSHKRSVETVSGGDKELINLLSLEKRVTKDTPPTFIWHTADDNAVPSVNSLEYAKSLFEKGVKFSLRIYPHGEHGVSLCDEQSSKENYDLSPDVRRWSMEAVEFLRYLGFVIED